MEKGGYWRINAKVTWRCNFLLNIYPPERKNMPLLRREEEASRTSLKPARQPVSPPPATATLPASREINLMVMTVHMIMFLQKQKSDICNTHSYTRHDYSFWLIKNRETENGYDNESNSSHKTSARGEFKMKCANQKCILQHIVIVIYIAGKTE